MNFGVITLLPDMLNALNYGITGRAIKRNLLTVSSWNPRDFTNDAHRTVDDRPYGGGPGMIMMAEPLQAAITAARKTLSGATVVLLSPQGKLFNQDLAARCLEKKELILVAGRYEGIDERLIQLEIDEEWSIGDYILSGGELPAMIIIDAVARLIPGALGHEESAAKDSLSMGILKHAQYTRPENFNGLKVPDVLLSGNHVSIERFRLKESLGRTWLKRPDLLAKMNLNELQSELLSEFIEEHKDRGKTYG